MIKSLSWVYGSLDAFRRGLQTLHIHFREVVLFGPLVFGLLTVVLLLPPFGGAGTDAVKYALLLCSLGLVGFSVRSGMKGAQLVWLNRWVIIFIAWITVLTVTARDPLAAFLGSLPRYNSSWIFFGCFAGTLWLCVFLGKELRGTLERLIMILSACVAVFGLFQSFGVGFYGGIGSTLSVTPDRVPSLLGNPNFSSWFVAAVLPFGLVYFFRAQTIWRKVVWGLFVFLSVWSIVIFSSRGSLLALLVGYVVFVGCMLFARRWRVALGLVGMAVLVVGVFGGYYSLYRPTGGSPISAIQDSSANERFVAWSVAGQMWSTHKWLGVGLGNFDQYYWELLPTTRMGGDQYFDDPHNVLLGVLAEMGLPGFILVTFLFGAAAVFVLRSMLAKPLAAELLSWPAATAGLAAWMVAALFNPTVIALWLLLAVLLASLYVEDQLRVLTLRFWWPSLVAWRLAGLVAVLLSMGILVSEYGLVYAIALEPYRSYPEAMARQARVTRVAVWAAPYMMEIRYANIFSQIRKGASADLVRSRIASTFALHPYSARSALVAAQLSADVWHRDHQQTDLDTGDRYLAQALQRSSGYPVVESWAAIYYWRTERAPQAEQYSRFATYKQPRYLDNWLLLAKIYREKDNLLAMQYALDKAQELAPGNVDLAKMRKLLRDTQDVHAIELRPGELPTITRLH